MTAATPGWCCGSIYWCCGWLPSVGAGGGCRLLVLWVYLLALGGGGLPSVGAVGVLWNRLHLTTSSAVGLFVYSYWSAADAGVRTGWSEQHCYLWIHC